MTCTNNGTVDTAELRIEAEGQGGAGEALYQENFAALSPAEIQKMLHELRVHQIELNVRNEGLRRARAELDVARTRSFDLYDLAPVGYCTIAETGLILEANLTVANLLGVARSVLVSQPLGRFILHEDKASYCRYRKQLLKTGQPQVCELRMTKADDAVLWVRLEATIAPAIDGPPVCLVALSDITERQRAEAAHRESEAKHRAIFENMAAACCYDQLIYENGLAVDYRILDVNPSFERITGIPRDRAVGACASGVYGTGQVPFLETYAKVAETGVPAAFEAYFAPIEKYLSVSVGCPGPGRFSTVFTDITESKRAEAKLAEQLDELRRWHNITMGRESRVLELKQEVNELLARAGQPPRYLSVVEEPAGSES
jgi:PAS domain S-box-containing protein